MSGPGALQLETSAAEAIGVLVVRSRVRAAADPAYRLTLTDRDSGHWQECRLLRPLSAGPEPEASESLSERPRPGPERRAIERLGPEACPAACQ